MRLFLLCDKTEKLSLNLPLNIEKMFTLEDLRDSFNDIPDAFLIHTENEAFLEEACKAIRQHFFPKVYLLPILLKTANHFSPKYYSMVDAVLPKEIDGESDESLSVVDEINEKISQLSIPAGTTDSDIVLKILRYFFTRNKEVKPVRDASSTFGLCYPEIEVFLTKEDSTVFSIFDLLEDRKFLSGNFFEKVHFCNKCYSAFLNFIEVCPNCGSSDLIIENLVHHFPCAYVGPEEDFERGDEFICPKCNKELKALGVDFDRPATVCKCNNCGYTAQDPDVKTICFNCGKETYPENLILKTIKTYTLTALGENVAIYGTENLFSIDLKKNIEILPYDTFSTMLKFEINRCNRYEIQSSILAFQIVNINDFYEKLGDKTQELFGEISHIIRTATRKSDVLSLLHEGLVLMLLPHTSDKGACMVLDKITTKINQLVSLNLGTEIEIKASIRQIGQSDEANPNALIEEVLEKMTYHQKRECI